MFAIAAAALLATKLSAEEVAKVDKVFAQYDHSNAPGCAVAVVRGKTIAYERGYGVADLEHDVVITPATRFDSGSVAKQFTAAAIVSLAEQGKLSLDDEIHKYLPEVPDYGAKITIRQLLHHTSGIRDAGSAIVAWGHSGEDLVGEREGWQFIARQKSLNFAPGTEWRYSNTGYVLLAFIVERASGRPFRDYMRESVFTPAGMRDSDIQDDSKRVFHGRAIGYDPAPSGDGFSIHMTNWAGKGCTGVITSVDDLARWMIDGQRFIQPLLTRDPLVTGETPLYAFGQLVTTRGTHRRIEHGGASAGYRSHMLMLPDDDLSVAVMCNLGSANPGGLADSVADALLGEVPALPVAKNVPPHTDGLYFDESTATTLRVATKDGQTTVGGGVVRQREDSGLQVGRLRNVAFRDGGVDVTDWGARTHHYVPAPPSKPVSESFAGRYHSDEANTDWTITVRNGKLYASSDRLAEFELTPLYENAFEGTVTFLTYVVEFSRDAFTMSDRGAYRLRFTRRTPDAPR